MPVNIAELERQARRPVTPKVYDYYAGGPGSDPARAMALAGARTSWPEPRG